jgi:hypothetical protein
MAAIEMNAANDAGTSATVTELDADNDTAPAFILTNAGIDVYNPSVQLAGPNLRLTPSTATGTGPTASTQGGDLTATSDGELWFTHDFGQPQGIVPARVRTDATSNVYVAVAPPTPPRILDTRSKSLRTNIINPSGNISPTTGQLLAKKTIYVDLDDMVVYADSVFATITVTQTTGSGFLTVWSGYVPGADNPAAPPNASTINWTAGGVTIANFMCSAAGAYPPGTEHVDSNNVIAIYADATTHVILDLAAFTMPGPEYALYIYSAGLGSPDSRLQRAQARLRAARQA